MRENYHVYVTAHLPRPASADEEQMSDGERGVVSALNT